MGYFSDEMIESEAAALREMMGLPSDSPLSWRDLESRMERAFPGIRLVVVPNEELRHAAEADTEQNRIRFRQTAYDQLRAGYEWALEVLAHELAHFKLDHKGIRYRSEGLSHGRKERRTTGASVCESFAGPRSGSSEVLVTGRPCCRVPPTAFIG